MKCPHCGLLSCSGGCHPPASRPNETWTERERRRRLERGDTLPDIEDEDDDELLDIDEAEEVTRV